MSITITWSAQIDGYDTLSVVRVETPILSFAEPEPEDAAATVLKWWLAEDAGPFKETNWDEYLGEEKDGKAIVIIHAPASHAGCFVVEVERTIQTRSYAADAEEAAESMALVSKETA